MYGISNSQQQGGGGGGAASYKAIKSTIAPSDWQEVAGATPFFVGENAMTWEVDEYGDRGKSQTTKLGLVSGNSYTITVVCDGQTYTQTAVAEVDDGIGINYDFSSQVNMYVYIYDDDMGSSCGIEGEATSFVITKFEGGGFGTIIQATISDSAITVNSAVTMYTNTSEKIAVGEKMNGSVTLTAPSVPTTAIPYSLEIVGTDTEGLFELVNGYIPDVPKIPASLPQTTSDFIEVCIRPSQWTKSTHTDGLDYYYSDFNVENMFDNTDALFRVNYAGYIEIEQKRYSGETGTATIRVTVRKLLTADLYIYYRLGKISGFGQYGTNVTVVNQSPEFITDKPDHLYLTDTATGTLYEVTIANGAISLVAQ